MCGHWYVFVGRHAQKVMDTEHLGNQTVRDDITILMQGKHAAAWRRCGCGGSSRPRRSDQYQSSTDRNANGSAPHCARHHPPLIAPRCIKRRTSLGENFFGFFPGCRLGFSHHCMLHVLRPDRPDLVRSMGSSSSRDLAPRTRCQPHACMQ